ncbi:FAD-dependent monooxygenase [Roseinatronobacter alkalisoli]|uniref:FAD-dependent monooxygenase n=1 Tax=Roseinatronobacter alkalisoli TaxID=3028235 RepID=A0ABT5TFA4_9RHOB|nr:FAD-dependent monooxygenase [Roseinatronobacter sp. HJB301]MDD7972842.1 FAD-dependent monooxygenase [Roseinatronobacter sp. HJB301]
MKHVSVLVAGGGPVGLTLARDLAQRGVDCLLVERNPTTTRHPKMDNTNVRSMELFRHAGLEDQLRAVAVPQDHPFDVAWVTTMTGNELMRFSYRAPAEDRVHYQTVNDGAQPFAPPMRVSQAEIEPVLRKALEAEDLAEIRFSTTLTDLQEDPDGVTATIRDETTGRTEQIRCQYLAGCDGGGSTVREAAGIRLDGRFSIMPRFMTHFRTDDPAARALLQRWGMTWHYQSVHGTLIAQNDVDTWTLHTRYPDNVTDGVSPEALVARFTGREIPMETLVANPWSPHLAVAQSAGTARILLAGDAGHQYIPTGGYGMNTGIGDAYALGWMLAAVVRGFAGQPLLEGYKAERWPVWQRNLAASARHNAVRGQIAALYEDAAIHQPGPAGDAVRRDAAAKIAAIGNAENESHGIELGYVYATSPVVATEDLLPSDDPVTYVPTTQPGARLPSLYLHDGRAVFDELGQWFTIIAQEDADITGLEASAHATGIPLTVLRHDDAHARAVWGAGILVVRPDQHVAWRGNSGPDRDTAQRLWNRFLGR